MAAMAFGYGDGSGDVAGVVVWEAGLWRSVQRRGELERNGGGGGAIVKRLQFLIPNRRAWWTGWDTPECAAHPSWEEEFRESERWEM